jgi:uncharacterized protein (DUF2237 family)
MEGNDRNCLTRLKGGEFVLVGLGFSKFTATHVGPPLWRQAGNATSDESRSNNGSRDDSAGPASAAAFERGCAIALTQKEARKGAGSDVIERCCDGFRQRGHGPVTVHALGPLRHRGGLARTPSGGVEVSLRSVVQLAGVQNGSRWKLCQASWQSIG